MATRWQVEGHVPLSIGMKMTSVSADGRRTAFCSEAFLAAHTASQNLERSQGDT